MEEWFAIPFGKPTCMWLSRIARLVAILLIPTLLVPDAAFAKKPLTPEKAKERITQRGIGHSVHLVLTDKAHVRGVIATIGNEDTGIGLEGSGQVQTVSYSNISEYHNGKLSKAGKIGWGVFGGLMGALVIWIAYLAGRDD